ncbi:MAG: hypothetical protein COV60_00930 [Candidatus Magasanikbacteria bacterium CG11_big_fil_rev_8_21_14_0_20_43_7]|uniref:Band 7 domain-containing protein n=1 Tax=Candidatus Magasanikbacteria bacterium CG11_big_fil_rev_8_21_14_0_20_43_7 TaxID=1974654 RepID=A0A2H0N347_9BACT|nr:MAG: hypothetical protein COV60_00930 [Candidatus Magasanikbacteria bacterium CG11_big_fil_rev_8_21_14_0_20_43_7]
MKRIFLTILLLCTVLPHVAYAQLDPRCWTLEECKAARAKQNSYHTMTDEELVAGFVSQSSQIAKTCGTLDGKTGADAVGTTLGFCLPGAQTETKISFGGKKEFLHIGDFIQTIYRYGIVAAGILSVVMIMAAGFIWITSGGNAERIGSAQKKIAGSVIGLVLITLSYTLLNTLNPALVNLRLPQIWMINAQGLAPPQCKDITGDKKQVALFGPSNMTPEQKQAEKAKVTNQTLYNIAPKVAKCGNDYFVQGTGGLSCTGYFCEKKGGTTHTCTPPIDSSGVSTCQPGNISGIIFMDSFEEKVKQFLDPIASIATDVVESEENFIIKDSFSILPVCCSDSSKECFIKDKISTSIPAKYVPSLPGAIFRVSASDEKINSVTCNSDQQSVGFILSYDININWSWTDSRRFVNKYGSDIKTAAKRKNIQVELNVDKLRSEAESKLKEKYGFVFKIANIFGRGFVDEQFDKLLNAEGMRKYLSTHGDDLFSKEDLLSGVNVNISISEALETISNKD